VQDAAPVEKPAPRDHAKDNDRDTSNARGRGRGRGRRNEDTGPKVQGMGDHMPEFIALSFEARMTSDADS